MIRQIMSPKNIQIIAD